MAITVTDLGGLGNYKVKHLAVTALTTARQAQKLGTRIFGAWGVNTNDTQAVKVEKNIDSTGAAASGTVAVANADAGPDTADVFALVVE